MILVVAATELEAELVDGAARTVVCGIGPVEAALAVAAAIAGERPSALLQIGIAGAQTLADGSVVIGEEAVYADILDPEARIPRVDRLPADRALVDAAKRALPDAAVLPIATSAHVGGGAICEVEAMEGFGALRAAALAGVPALELRAISNLVAEPDRDRWRIDEALAALRAAVPRVLEELARA